jgi:hypothetical protein
VTLVLAQWQYSNTATLTLAEAENLIARIRDAIAKLPVNTLPDIL